jgi:hypothetical protein
MTIFRILLLSSMACLVALAGAQSRDQADSPAPNAGDLHRDEAEAIKRLFQWLTEDMEAGEWLFFGHRADWTIETIRARERIDPGKLSDEFGAAHVFLKFPDVRYDGSGSRYRVVEQHGRSWPSRCSKSRTRFLVSHLTPGTL